MAEPIESSTEEAAPEELAAEELAVEDLAPESAESTENPESTES